MSVNKFGGKQLYVKNIELYVKNIELYVKNIENNCMSRQIWWKTIVCQEHWDWLPSSVVRISGPVRRKVARWTKTTESGLLNKWKETLTEMNRALE